MSQNLKDKVALVTGGSRGIGRAICIELARSGAHIYVNYNSNSAAAEETVAKCRDLGGSASAVQFDVAAREGVDSAFESIKSKHGRLDILINNAGIVKDGLFVRYKDGDWDKLIQTNLTGAFYCSRAASALMIRSRWGRIVNMSSVVAEMGNAGQSAYVASKAGILGLTKALAKELAVRNVTVNAITPGFIETDMTGALDEKSRAKLLEEIPLARLGQPADVSGLVCFLCSDAASYITGQVIGVNGGIYM